MRPSVVLFFAAAMMGASACGLLAGLHDVSPPDEVGTPDGGGTSSKEGGHDDGGMTLHGDSGADRGGGPAFDTGADGPPLQHDTGTMSSGTGTGSGLSGDSGVDAGPIVPDGSVLCISTPTVCPLGDGGGCCLSIYGDLTEDGGTTYTLSQAACGVSDCGGLDQVGGSYNYEVATECSGPKSCAGGTVCCASVTAGEPTQIDSVACTAAASCPGTILCDQLSDCPTGKTCKPETDPFLSHFWTKDCQ